MFKSNFFIAILLLGIFPPLVSASPGKHHNHQKYSNHDRHHTRYAKVIFVKPIYRTIQIQQPRLDCQHQNPRHSSVTVVHQHSPERIIMGGVLGGIIGHGLGNAYNRDVTTLAGVVIGSAIAHDVSTINYSSQHHPAVPQSYCRERVSIIEQRKLVGYKVKYKYRGNVFTTRTHYHPGKRIEIQTEPGHNRRFDY